MIARGLDFSSIVVVGACFDDGMLDRIDELVAGLRHAVSAMDARTLSAADAARLVEAFAEGERLCAAGRTIAAGRVQRSPVWHAAGFRTPAQWMAARTKVSLSQAITSLETARRIERQPPPRERFLTARLSPGHSAQTPSAARATPQCEAALAEDR